MCRSFEEWVEELKEIYAKEGFITEQMDFSYETWKDYFEDGSTPQEAFDEELSRAD